MAIESETAIAGPKPDRIARVPVEGGEVVAYVYGESNPETVLAINGGPGNPSLGLREPLIELVRRGYRLVIHDQLGTGASDCPDDARLWSLRRYVDEVDRVRAALCGERVHLFGHSWGGFLAIEYAVTHPERLRSAILSNTGGSLPVHVEELRRLLSAMGGETLAIVDECEREGRLDHPQYQAICAAFYNRHSSRKTFESGERRPARAPNMQIQIALWGPAEFSLTGELRDWNRLSDLARVRCPALVCVGAYDYITPRSAGLLERHLPDGRLVLFPESGHGCFLDEPESYFDAVSGFLDRASHGGKG